MEGMGCREEIGIPVFMGKSNIVIDFSGGIQNIHPMDKMGLGDFDGNSVER